MLLLLHECGSVLRLLMVLYGVGWFWLVIYCSGRFWHDLWIDFCWRSSCDLGCWSMVMEIFIVLDYSCHGLQDSLRWSSFAELWQVEFWFLEILYSVGWFLPVDILQW